MQFSIKSIRQPWRWLLIATFQFVVGVALLHWMTPWLLSRPGHVWEYYGGLLLFCLIAAAIWVRQRKVKIKIGISRRTGSYGATSN